MSKPSTQQMQDGYIQFVQSELVDQARRINKFANRCNGVHQLSTADMSQNGAALMFGIAGRNTRTMKSDLSDGSEVKGATNIDTATGVAAWVFNFSTDKQVKRYQNAPRIITTVYYEVDGRKRADTYAFSGADPTFRKLVRNFKAGGYTTSNLSLRVTPEDGVVHHGLGKMRLPLVCRAEENDQGQMEITHWLVDECKRATDLIQTGGIDALSAKQKEQFLIKPAKK